LTGNKLLVGLQEGAKLMRVEKCRKKRGTPTEECPQGRKRDRGESGPGGGEELVGGYRRKKARSRRGGRTGRKLAKAALYLEKCKKKRRGESKRKNRKEEKKGKRGVVPKTQSSPRGGILEKDTES